MTENTAIVIGGLINQHTGEVIATATDRRQMHDLRLRACNLNGEPWRRGQEFGFFEFTGTLGWNPAFLQRDMRVPIPDQVFTWHKAYKAKEAEDRAAAMRSELATMEQARAAMSAIPGFHHFEHLIDAEISKVRYSVVTLQG